MPRVTFYIVRHGFSCSNMASMTDMRDSQKDPSLTRHGIAESRRLGDLYRRKRLIPDEIDFVFASCLSRAIATAYFMFCERNKQSIFVVPGLRELRSRGAQLDPFDQDVRRLDPMDKNIKYRVIREPRAYVQDDALAIPDFVEWFLSNYKGSQDMVIAAASHGGRMAQDLRMRDVPHNNACVRLIFEKQGSRWVRAEGPVEIHEGSPPPARPNVQDDLCKGI
jgi:broad specificity phosphatase PhoE